MLIILVRDDIMGGMQILQKFERRFEITLVFILFFPTLINALNSNATDQIKTNSTILSWGTIVVIFIICYLLLETLGQYISEKIINYSSNLLLIEIALLGFMMFILSAVQDNDISVSLTEPIKLSVQGLVFVPLSILVMFAGNFVYLFYKEIKEIIKKQS